MKKLIAYTTLLTLLLGLTVVSCGGDDNNGDEPAQPGQTLKLRTQSIAEGETVDASVAEITLTFNNVIQTVSGKDITVNGTKAQTTATGMDLKVQLQLQRWADYEVVVPAGAIAIKDNAKAVNNEIKIRFNTKYGYEPGTEPSVAAAPVNPNATAEAKALYKTLRDNYGKTMLSGAMGGVAWETTYTDYISSQTGKYPAVVGFDYIHLSYSPANWIDYGDITPVKRVHDRGCVVQIQWHWNVPKSQGSSDMTCNQTTFKPSNIMVEGTWENKVATADLDKLAGYLKLLQDAGIPVLWRPLHEAAGDYKWGAWFWWGSEGTEVTKKLYQYLYDKLTNHYKLNNLIWVWTVQTSSEGKAATLAQRQAAYPGNEYVDIVGTDIYPDKTLTDQSAQFKLVDETTGSSKIVALTECGNLIDPQKAIDKGALWSYYMQWYDMKDGKYGFYNYSGPAQWNTVLGHTAVISK